MIVQPKPPLRDRAIYQAGRLAEVLGYLLAMSGLIYAFYVTVNGSGIARLVNAAQRAVLGKAEPPTTATFVGLACLLPGLVLIKAGSALMARGRLADPIAEANRRARWHDRLLGRRPGSIGRSIAVLACVAIALAAVVIAVAIWPKAV